jgi:hypothetical protein
MNAPDILIATQALVDALEKGIQPTGTYFDRFTSEDEQLTWAYPSEDFQTPGYRRFDPSLPEDAPNSLSL